MIEKKKSRLFASRPIHRTRCSNQFHVMSFFAIIIHFEFDYVEQYLYMECNRLFDVFCLCIYIAVFNVNCARFASSVESFQQNNSHWPKSMNRLPFDSSIRKEKNFKNIQFFIPISIVCHRKKNAQRTEKKSVKDWKKILGYSVNFELIHFVWNPCLNQESNNKLRLMNSCLIEWEHNTPKISALKMT